jgi:hypothetical protein
MADLSGWRSAIAEGLAKGPKCDIFKAPDGS